MSPIKLSTLTKINTGILVFIAVVLGTSLFVGMQELRKPLNRSQEFSNYKSQLDENIVHKLNLYLRSGNAQFLSEAEQNIASLVNLLKTGSDNQYDALILKLSEFNGYLTQNARAAGKLAGNEDGLLLQNERETRDELSALFSYANDGQELNLSLASDYSALARDLIMLMQDRTLQRQQTLSTGSRDVTSIRVINQEMAQLVSNLDQLERIGIYQVQEEDDFADLLGGAFSDDEEEREDKAEEIISNLRSLVNRYMKEVDNTLNVKATISNSYQTIQNNITDISASFKLLEQQNTVNFETLLANGRNIMMLIILIIVVLSVMVDSAQRGIAKRIRTFVPFLETYAKGDFRKHVDIKAKTYEVKVLVNSANQLKSNLIDLISDVKLRSEQVLGLGQNVRHNSEQVVGKMNEQLERTITISAAVEEMNVSFRDVAQNAVQAADSASNINSLATNSSNLMAEATQDIKDLAGKVDETSNEIAKLGSLATDINAVLDVINGIAEQTNLLALNAAIEAARAGENGRGFAVVADEVRSLSQRTADSTKEIQGIIDNIQSQAENCIGAMEQQVTVVSQTVERNNSANDSVQSIVTAISDIKDKTTQIAVNVDQQVKVAEDISRSIHDVRDISENTNLAANKTATLSDDMQAQNLKLQDSIEQFKF